MHIHDDKPLFKCNACGKAFHRKDKYMEHLTSNVRVMESLKDNEVELVPLEDAMSNCEETVHNEPPSHGDYSDPCEMGYSALDGGITTKMQGGHLVTDA